MIDPKHEISLRLQRAMVDALGDDGRDADPLLRATNNPKFGDFQANLAMSLGKKLKKNPREIAQAVVDAAQLDDLCEAVDIAGPGFINLRLKEDYLAKLCDQMLQDDRLGVPKTDSPDVVVVDYSSPNVAKEMHVGHLRSTVIGDAIVRVLDFLGHKVIRQNHVGDWGTQFGMLIEYMVRENLYEQGNFRVSDLNALYKKAKEAFDADTDFAHRARERVVKLQRGDEQSFRLWRALVEESQRHFQEAYERLGVLCTPDDIMGESAYNDVLDETVAELKEKGLVEEDQGAQCIFVEGFAGKDGDRLPFLIQKSDGAYLYATTDLAAFRHRVRNLQATRLCYVTDARQSQHFAMLFAVVKKAGWYTDDIRAQHVPFGMVLGDDGKPFKTRSGETVKLSDLLDEADARALEVVRSKQAELSEEQQREVAHVVGMGAIKYADLASDRKKDYVFNWDRMLSMEGNTAPYLQYAYARIQSIFRKVNGFQPDAARIPDLKGDYEKQLALKLLAFGEAVQAVERDLEPHKLCTYLHEMASSFSSFYTNCKVATADNEADRQRRLGLCVMTSRVMQQGLALLGINILQRM